MNTIMMRHNFSFFTNNLGQSYQQMHLMSVFIVRNGLWFVVSRLKGAGI